MKILLILQGLETSYGEVIGHCNKIELPIIITKEQLRELKEALRETSDYNISFDIID